jgi:hypothetical protein
VDEERSMQALTAELKQKGKKLPEFLNADNDHSPSDS